MPDNSTRSLAITLPQSLLDDPVVGGNMPAVLTLNIVDDAKISGGNRAIARSYRDSNVADPARIRRVEWQIWGPIGASLESSAVRLGTAFTQNLETRWERRLISAGLGTTVTLTSKDPPGTGAVFDIAIFDTAYFSSSAGGVGGQNVVVFDEQFGYLFAGRGELETQIDLTSWSVIATQDMNAQVLDADHWHGFNYVALGSVVPLQRRIGAGITGATYVDTVATSPSEKVYATAIKRGSDRAWYINANQAESTYNFAGYTLDDFVTLASPFQVGDPMVGANGIGPWGPFTFFGFEDNFYSFTDQGKPIPLSRALTSHHSAYNGQQWADPGWGWNYAKSAIGLRAVQTNQDNPVGIGERMREFTGHNGLPTAIWQERGELWVAYQTTAGDTYIYRGVFSRIPRTADEQGLNFGQGVFGSQTSLTGQCDFYPFAYLPNTYVGAIFSSPTPNNDVQYTTIIYAKGTNLVHTAIASNGRDDLAPNYAYSVAGGTWYGTTLDRDANLLKTFRLARFHTRSMASGDSWELQMGFDISPINTTGASYVSIGTVTTNGYQTLIPTNGGADSNGNPTPTPHISGRTMTPRLIQIAGGAGAGATPPEINGTLEVEYDERPDQWEEIDVVCDLQATGYSNNLTWYVLNRLASQYTDGPLKIQLPDDPAAGVSGLSGGGQVYAFLGGVTDRKDVSDNNIQAVTLKFLSWPRSDALFT